MENKETRLEKVLNTLIVATIAFSPILSEIAVALFFLSVLMYIYKNNYNN